MQTTHDTVPAEQTPIRYATFPDASIRLVGGDPSLVGQNRRLCGAGSIGVTPVRTDRITTTRRFGCLGPSASGGLTEANVDDETTYLNNQFIYGPGYGDEMIAQVPRAEGDWPVLVFQDANYNVSAIVDYTWGDVLARYLYDPYGNIVDIVGQADYNAVGHHGLFFDRFTADRGERQGNRMFPRNSNVRPMQGEAAFHSMTDLRINSHRSLMVAELIENMRWPRGERAEIPHPM